MGSLAEQTRWMDATAQAELVTAGEVTPLELAEAAIERIEALDGADQRGHHAMVRPRPGDRVG
jgi:amidase